MPKASARAIPNASASADVVVRPSNWDKRVSAAYLRILGGTQAEAAKAVGVSARAIRLWEADEPAWTAARYEAEERWLSGITDASRVTLLGAIRSGDAGSARWILERVDDRLKPPASAAHAVLGVNGSGSRLTFTLSISTGQGDGDGD